MRNYPGCCENGVAGCLGWQVANEMPCEQCYYDSCI